MNRCSPNRRTLIRAGLFVGLGVVAAAGGCSASRTVVVENQSDEPLTARLSSKWQGGQVCWLKACIAPGETFEYSMRSGQSSNGTILEVSPAKKELVEPLTVNVPDNDTTRIKVVRQPEQFQLHRVR